MVPIFSFVPSLNNIKITMYFNYEPRFNSIFLRHDLLRLLDGSYVINIDDSQSKGTYWTSLFIHKNTAVYLDSLRNEYISQKISEKNQR